MSYETIDQSELVKRYTEIVQTSAAQKKRIAELTEKCLMLELRLGSQAMLKAEVDQLTATLNDIPCAGRADHAASLAPFVALATALEGFKSALVTGTVCLGGQSCTAPERDHRHWAQVEYANLSAVMSALAHPMIKKALGS